MKRFIINSTSGCLFVTSLYFFTAFFIAVGLQFHWHSYAYAFSFAITTFIISFALNIYAAFTLPDDAEIVEGHLDEDGNFIEE